MTVIQARNLRIAGDTCPPSSGVESAATVRQSLAFVRLQLPHGEHYRRGHCGAVSATRLALGARLASFRSIVSTASGPACCGSGIRFHFPSVTGTIAAPFTDADLIPFPRAA